ncbi:dipeptide ABC transporter ATP-binding protein [Streptomyces sp. TRM S81-3]|uniref:Dipeptide ABC transporter ATP-binding protein n=1 Tax=Streptomyces griseicoloratus TaxID=2752516 RepID=A0A926QRU1_9ACTN|nr:dipeptide ABC transporter ATP-binding protein [Streptomyces griseicoloratus]MBD0421060.1 dipeptide ABC transporter ATP-binding protein [Streptomyces griseicoloratus]
MAIPAQSDGTTLTKDPAAGDVLLKVTGLQKHFPIKKGLLQRQVGAVHAVDGLDFEVRAGETLGVVGESGCGKSTMGRLITRLLEPTGGKIEFEGTDITHLGVGGMRPLRRDVQMIFQDPYSSLNPRHTIGTIIGAPFKLQGVEPEGGIKKEVQRLLSVVGLNPEHYNRYPHEFSGGQRQRIGIARALALNPKLVVADEPVSALDVSIQAQVVNLLDDLQQELGLTYVIIAHDLSVVRHVSDRIAVMYLGKIVELADRDLLYKTPMHPYTKALMSAVPIPDPARKSAKSERILLKGDVPSPISPPSGCRFHTRCWKATEICKTKEPPLLELRPGQQVACHHPENFEDQAPQDTVLLSDAKEAAELVSEEALAESAATSAALAAEVEAASGAGDAESGDAESRDAEAGDAEAGDAEADGSAESESAKEEAAASESAESESAESESAESEPAESEPAASEPVASEPAASESTESEPPAKEK